MSRLSCQVPSFPARPPLTPTGRKPTLEYDRIAAALSRGGVDGEAVMAVVDDQVPGQRADRVGADAPAVHGRVDVDVDVGVAVVGLLLGVPLDPADDVAVEHDHVGGDVGLVEVLLDRGARGRRRRASGGTPPGSAGSRTRSGTSARTAVRSCTTAPCNTISAIVPTLPIVLVRICRHMAVGR